MPVPLSATVNGLFDAFVAIVSDAEAAPTAVGVSVTEIVQLEPAPSVLPQVVPEIANGDPVVTEVDVMVSGVGW
jgi:hypothetical protein